MIDEFISKVGNAIKSFFLGVFSFDWIPEIFIWYVWLFVLFLLCGAIIWFFGWSKIIRMIASVGFLFAAVFVAGGHYMARRLKAREKPPEKPKPKKVEPEPWKWPWEANR